MKSTVTYYTNLASLTSIKRVEHGQVWCFRVDEKRWEPSAYDIVDLHDGRQFKKITQREARKLNSAPFRKPFNVNRQQLMRFIAEW